MVDPARLCIAAAPLAAYLLVLGALHLSGRPIVVNGRRDLLALGLGLSGLAVVGPIELLTSTRVVLSLGPPYWMLVIALYGATWLLVATYARPRLVIYNVLPDELATAATRAARRLDAEAHWAGQTLLLPNGPLQVAVESFATLRSASLVAAGEAQSPDAWHDLEVELRGELLHMRASASGLGFAFLIAASVLFVTVAAQWIFKPSVVARGLLEMIGLG